MCCLAVLLLLSCGTAFASELAELTGYVSDPTGARVPHCRIQVTNVDTNISYLGDTNDVGLYRISAIPVGNYRVIVQKAGFKTVVKQGIELHVQDVVSLNFQLEVGAVAESITVEGGAPLVNTESAAVSTVVDRNFAENLPLNGRSFQGLIDTTPGVVVAAVSSSGFDAGQFNVNGQRANANYWTVDGVSANIGTSTVFGGDGVGGALGSFSVLGGTNSLVSVDALQEFRIQTSTYAPEFGRTPGGQISIATRSGTNQFHGTLFDYLRNDVLDANNWFNGFCKSGPLCPLPKAKERQNDFGGTFGGPIVKDRTFFFFSYEGFRLRLPQTAQVTVPDLNARSTAVPAMQPYLNSYPQPNGTDNLATGVAQFNTSFSNPASLDAYSLRVDHKLSDRVTIFGRYNYSPSGSDQRGASGATLSDVLVSRITNQTGTVGTTFAVSPHVVNDLRFNYSRVNASSFFFQDTFGGAVPLASLGLPNGFTSSNARVVLIISSLTGGLNINGDLITNLQRQWNLVDSVSLQKSSHALKFGVDFRRLSPLFAPLQYGQIPFFPSVASAKSGNALIVQQAANARATLLFHNLSLFAQDSWRVVPRLTVTYGLRWDVDSSPSTLSGPSFPAVTGFNLSDLSQLAIAPSGTPTFNTPYGNLAPRLGVAYQVSENKNWGTVVRGGFGVFFDLATQQVGNLIGQLAFPFGASSNSFGATFPLNPATAAPPPITPPTATSGTVLGFDPNFKLPYSLEWNVALQQELGPEQALSATYVGSAGRRLIQSTIITKPNANIARAILVGNTATSDYDALQLQFQRQLSHGLQALASYTWSHSLDDASSGSIFFGSTLVRALGANANRGPSDFDIRHTFNAALTYDVPAPKLHPLANAVLRGWSLQNILQARSAPPVNLNFGSSTSLLDGTSQIRPDVVPGIPLFLFGPQFPGGMAINNTPRAVVGGCPDGSASVGPFCPPPKNAQGVSTRQGNLGRNALRGFGATQWDFAVHRDFPVRETLKLQFRAEMFNVLNHPNFGQPNANLNDPKFGQATQLLNQALSSNVAGAGGFNPLYQIGGPRSIQLALKLMF